MTTTQGDFECDFDVEADFTGRDTDLKKIYEAWGSHRIFGIFGLRSVGKSRLVKEFLERYITKDYFIVAVDVKQLMNISSLYSNICIKLGAKTEAKAHESDKWIHHIVEELRKRVHKNVILFFDNTEDYQELKGADTRDAFLSLCTQVAKWCKHVKIVLTSTTRVQFTQQAPVYFSHKVLPLKQTETRQLLRSVTSGVHLGEYEDAIVSLSEGLPLLILMIGSELTEDGGMLTPKDIVECLLTSRLKTLSKDFYPKEDRVADVYKDFIDRLAEAYRHQLTILEYIPGTFNVDQVKQILDAETEAMVKYQALKPMLGRHFLNYDSMTGRLNIQGILRECLHAYYTIKNLPEIRARYCRIFTAVIVGISKRLNTRQYTEAMVEFTVEHPNLQKLLTDVKYTTQDTYRFYIQIATDCTELVDKFMSGNGEEFYQGCTRIADMFGKDRDRAAVHIAVGSFYTNTKSILVRGAESYDSALQILQKHGRSLQLVTVYQRKGWNLHKQGNNIAAVKYFKKSLATSMISGEEYQTVLLQSMNSMGISLTELGHFEDSERYHFASLKRRLTVQGEDHPGVGTCLNNIGVMYEEKGDLENALTYYQKGLEVKLKSKAPVMSVVFSLRNAANMSMAVGNYEEAHRLLDDALRRLQEEKTPHKEALAYTYDTRGNVYLREKKLDDAEEMFQKAVEIRQNISKNLQYFESLVHLADVNKRKGKFKQSINISKNALILKDKAIAAMPQNLFVAECYRCLADVYNRTSDIEKHRETLEKVENELIRLEQVYLCQCNEKRLQNIRTQLNDIKDKLHNMPDQ